MSSSIIKRFKIRRGFTLVELLAVVFIIGVLAAIGVVYTKDARQRSRDTTRKAYLHEIQTLVETKYNITREYYRTNAEGIYSDTTEGSDWNNAGFGQFKEPLALMGDNVVFARQVAGVSSPTITPTPPGSPTSTAVPSPTPTPDLCSINPEACAFAAKLYDHEPSPKNRLYYNGANQIVLTCTPACTIPPLCPTSPPYPPTGQSYLLLAALERREDQDYPQSQQNLSLCIKNLLAKSKYNIYALGINWN